MGLEAINVGGNDVGFNFVTGRLGGREGVADRVEQVDLFLDVWVSPEGETLILDEDEFTADTTLSNQQRSGARQALQELLQMIADHKEAFST